MLLPIYSDFIMGKFAERQRRKVNGLRSDDYDGITAIICKCRIAVFLSSRGKQEHRVLSVPVFFERKNTFMKKLFLLGTILIIAVTLIFLVCCNKAEVTDTITTEYGDCFNIVQDGDGFILFRMGKLMAMWLILGIKVRCPTHV